MFYIVVVGSELNDNYLVFLFLALLTILYKPIKESPETKIIDPVLESQSESKDGNTMSTKTKTIALTMATIPMIINCLRIKLIMIIVHYTTQRPPNTYT